MKMQISEKLLSLVQQGVGASIDTRTLQEGNIFFALPGNYVDGHRFVEHALNKGASAVVVSKRGSVLNEQCYLVDDVLDAMQHLARYYRHFLDPVVMAVTGSNGKTTNKNLLKAIFQKKYKTHATSGNYNNEIGVPLTILNAGVSTEFLIVEMGTNHFGEIDQLCRIAEPGWGSIVNIGKSHLEFLGSEEGVLKAKAELADYLSLHDGVLFVNKEEKSIDPFMEHKVRKIVFDRNHLPGTVERKIRVEKETPFIQLEIMEGEKLWKVHSPLWGAHNVKNLIHAIGVGLYFDVPVEEIVMALESFSPEDNRSQILEEDGFQIYLDAYNANPTSMYAAIKAFSEIHPEGAVVLGDMGELGECALEEHKNIVEKILSMSFRKRLLVGSLFTRAAEGKPGLTCFSDTESAQKVFDALRSDPSISAVLIKGSRSMGLEQLV